MRTFAAIAIFLVAGIAVLFLRHSGMIQETVANWLFVVLIVLATGTGIVGWRKSQAVEVNCRWRPPASEFRGEGSPPIELKGKGARCAHTQYFCPSALPQFLVWSCF